MTDADGQRWVSLQEAARHLGKSTDAVRSLLRRDKLPKQRGNDGSWLVGIRDDQSADGQATADDRQETVKLQELVSELREEVAELRQALVKAEAERETAQQVAAERVALREDRIAELRQEVERLRRPWWRRVWS